jgi:hypothetical protein
MTRLWKTALALSAPAALVGALLLHPLPAAAGGEGRYKKGPHGECVWDAKDTGPDQCKPPKKGRYKKDGDKCVWDANDTGPNQCEPPKKP